MVAGSRIPHPPSGWKSGDTHYLWGRQLFSVLGVQGLCHQSVSQNSAKMAGHDSLLLQPTVVLKGQDDRVWGQLEGGTAAQSHFLPCQDPPSLHLDSHPLQDRQTKALWGR